MYGEHTSFPRGDSGLKSVVYSFPSAVLLLLAAPILPGTFIAPASPPVYSPTYEPPQSSPVPLQIILLLLLSATALAQADSPHADFANLARYRAANEALPPPAPDGRRVVLIGNSITDGWARKYPGFFSDHDLVGRGISGQTSPQLLLRFRQDVLDLQPDAVVIHIGTNDVAENTGPYDPEFTLGNIQSMVELARANDIRVYLASVLPATGFGWRQELGDRSGMIVELNRRLAAYAAAEGIPYIDYHAALRNDANGMDATLAADGVHPTAEGYAIMEALLLDALND